MEKCIIWYFLSLKSNLKSRGTWMAAAGMLLVIWIISEISIPGYSNMQAGIWYGDSEAAKIMKAEINQNESAFEILEYQSEEELYFDVVAGRIDCGFLLPQDLDEKIENDKIKNAIIYLSTPFTSKGEVLKESIYAAFFKNYSRNILYDTEEEIYGNHDIERMERLLKNNREYLDSSHIFQIEIEEVLGQKEAEVRQYKDISAGLVGLYIFLTMFVVSIRTRLKDGDYVGLALNELQQSVYCYMKMLAAATIPFGFGLLFLISRQKNSNAPEEGLHLILFILLCGIWINVIGKLVRKAELLPMWILVWVVVHSILCPLFFDFSIYIPAIEGMRAFLPLSWYQLW